ncbi:MAG: DNA polymerase III subunit delta', partial [Planctomycetes bacterium]|nr:DNA polymerase III subunit delta' [Planctomycetota bacterium]
MSFKRILCQNNVIQLFQGIIAKGRIAHAYIFTGTDGVGKALFAKELV